MRCAILSDIHGNQLALERVLADANLHDVETVLCLGDVGSDACLDRLREAGAKMVFGNWEVSQWGHLREDNQAWVKNLPPMLEGDTYMAVHAAPWWPKGLSNVEDFMTYLLRQGIKWRVLFPYLDEDEAAFWRALAELEEADRRVLFHGHTHVQMARCQDPTGRVTTLRGPTFALDRRARYVVGVGSVGRPEDSPDPKYALYDDASARIELKTLA